RISSPYKLAARSFRPEGTIVKFANGLEIGGKSIVVMAGPCSVESREQLFSLFFPGTRTGRTEASSRGWRPLQAARDQRGHGNLADSAHAALRRHFPGRSAQHAELQPAARTGQDSQADSPQARHRGYTRRTAALGRVRARRWELRDYSV